MKGTAYEDEDLQGGSLRKLISGALATFVALSLALADQNDAWATRQFMDAAGMRDLMRDAEAPAPTEEALARAEIVVLKAMRMAA